MGGAKRSCKNGAELEPIKEKPHCDRPKRISIKKSQAEPEGSICEICSKLFSCAAYLRAHLKCHAQDRPYKCDECDKAFKRPGNLAEHKNIHTGRKAYKCDECGKSFTQMSTLHVHKRTHTGHRPFSCSQCAKSFFKIGDLNVHQKSHINDRKFECSKCNRMFLRLSALKLHSLLHSKELPYKCKLCEGRFRTTSDFQRHKKRSVDCCAKDNVAIKLVLLPSEPTNVETSIRKEVENDEQPTASKTIITNDKSATKDDSNNNACDDNYDVKNMEDEVQPNDSCVIEWLNESDLEESRPEHGQIDDEETFAHISNGNKEEPALDIDSLDDGMDPELDLVDDSYTDRPFICKKCGKLFKKFHHLVAHDRLHTGRLKAKAKSQTICLSKFNCLLLFSFR